MPFIPPMLATRLEDPRRLADPRYIAEPKLDGQRAQLHVRDHRTVHAYSRPGRELIGLPGLAWLGDIRWPSACAVLDGEVVAGDGSEGIQAVFEARHRQGSAMAFTAVRPCGDRGPQSPGGALDGPAEAARGSTRVSPPGVCLVPVTDDAPALWDAWVGQGGEGHRPEGADLALSPWGALVTPPRRARRGDRQGGLPQVRLLLRDVRRAPVGGSRYESPG
jgi:hypothetical protein